MSTRCPGCGADTDWDIEHPTEDCITEPPASHRLPIPASPTGAGQGPTTEETR